MSALVPYILQVDAEVLERVGDMTKVTQLLQSSPSHSALLLTVLHQETFSLYSSISPPSPRMNCSDTSKTDQKSSFQVL